MVRILSTTGRLQKINKGTLEKKIYHTITKKATRMWRYLIGFASGVYTTLNDPELVKESIEKLKDMLAKIVNP